MIGEGYHFKSDSLVLGGLMVENKPVKDATIQLPLKTLNRHGLIAGATGTGKTKTLQGIAEQLCAAGVPVVMADVKGDLSGLSKPGADNEKIRS